MRRILVVTSLAIVLAACGASESTTETTTPATTNPPLELEVVDPPVTTIAPGEVPEDFLAELMADAAERTGLAESELSVAIAESVTWSDGSLGCPEPGMSYTQALVDGYRVVVSTPDGDIDYRTGGTDFFVVCEQA